MALFTTGWIWNSTGPRADPAQPDFWKNYSGLPVADFARFLALAKKGKPFSTVKNPEGKDKSETDQLGQKAEIERSIKYCQQVLGLGLKG